MKVFEIDRERKRQAGDWLVPQRVQQLNPHVRCCFMSGYTDKYSGEQLLAMGALFVFPKPFDSLRELACKLREIASGAIRK